MAMHTQTYFEEVVKVAQAIDAAAIERLARELADLRERGGRLFLLGGGDLEKNVSPNIVAGLKEAKQRGLQMFFPGVRIR